VNRNKVGTEQEQSRNRTGTEQERNSHGTGTGQERNKLEFSVQFIQKPWINNLLNVKKST
jgi:hypothetical protein